MSNWRLGGVAPGQLFVVHAQDFGRVGHCWMKGRLKDGDLIMSIGLSGDCFWTYCLVENHSTNMYGRQQYRLIKESSFGAYTIGELYGFQPTDREAHLLQAGEYVTLEADRRMLWAREA
jgi:hypothetical protein